MHLPARVVNIWEHAARVTISLAAALAVAGIVLAWRSAYVPLTVVPAAVVVGGAIWWLWARTTAGPVDADDDGWALIVGLVGIGAVTLWHMRHSGQYLMITRDPAFYNLGGIELAERGDLLLRRVPEALASIPGVRLHSQGIRLHDGNGPFLQGWHGLDAMSAPAHWIGGAALYFKAPAAIGGAALVVFRRVAVRLSTPWVATAVTLAFGLSMPFGVFSRDSYSEIATLLLALGAVLALVEGRPGVMRFVVVGALGGATATTRVDSLLFLAAVFLAMVAVAVLDGPVRAHVAALGAGAASLALTGAAGFFPGIWLSPGYYGDLSSQTREQLLAVAATGVLALGVAVAPSVARRVGGLLAPARRDRLADVAGWAVVLAGLAWWLVLPGFIEVSSRDRDFVAGLQAAEGVPIDADRLYGEQSLVRLSWVFGDLLVLAAVIGAGLAVRAVIARRDRAVAAVLAVGATSTYYLYEPRITPDMPWAFRRFLPVVIPVVLLLAAVALATLLRRRDFGRWIAVPVLAAVVLLPLSAYRPVAGARNDVPVATFVDGVCAAVPEGGTLVVTHRFLSNVGIQTFSTVCDIDTVGVAAGADPQPVVAAAARAVAATDGELYVLSNDDESGLPSALPALEPRLLAVDAPFVRNTLEELPNAVDRRPYRAIVARIDLRSLR